MNKTKIKQDLMEDGNPGPEKVLAERQAAGLSQQAAADLVGLSRRFWQYVEAGDKPLGDVHWTAFLLMIDRHPGYKLVGRARK